MTVNWCTEHGFNGWIDASLCLWEQVGREAGLEDTPCRMIQVDLVPHESLLTGVTAADVIMDEPA